MNVAVGTPLSHNGPMAERGLLGLGQAIAERRRALGKTQEDLAHEADMSLRHLQKIEGAQTFPRLPTLFAIAHALGLKPQGLLDEADEVATKRRR